MSNYYSNEVLITDLLKNRCKEIVNVEDMRLMFNDLKLLEKLLVESGKRKCGNNKCLLVNSKEIDKVLFNVVVRWNNIKLGI